MNHVFYFVDIYSKETLREIIMKINLADNMLRFGVKNLNETATRKIKTIAEQAPTQPQTAVVNNPTTTPQTNLKKFKDIPIDDASLFWNNNEQKSIATIDADPLTDNKNYIIRAIKFTGPNTNDSYNFIFQKPLMVPIGTNINIINSWKPLIEASLKSTDITKLSMYMNFPGGSQRITGAITGKSINIPPMVTTNLATSIFNGLAQSTNLVKS